MRTRDSEGWEVPISNLSRVLHSQSTNFSVYAKTEKEQHLVDLLELMRDPLKNISAEETPSAEKRETKIFLQKN